MKTDSGRRASFSYRAECPIICCDGHLLACVTTGTGTYTPQLVIQRNDVIDSLREQISALQKQTKTMTEAYSRHNSAKDFLLSSPIKSKRSDSTYFASPQKNDVLLRISQGNQNKPCPHTEQCCTPNQRKTEFQCMMKWACENGNEYVNAETVTSAEEAGTFLDLILEARLASVVTLKVNSDKEIIITYQILHDFRQDFMIVKVNSGHCLLMRAF